MDGLRPLTSSEEATLASVTVVGMRFYPGAFDRLIAASKKPTDMQSLFLVQEFDNEHDAHAVMLHDGKMKLASVSASDAPAIRRLLDNTNDVVVCSMSYVPKSQTSDFKYTGSIKVRGLGRVNERLARKFADVESAQEK